MEETIKTNEFENLEVEQPPAQEFAETPDGLISANSQGTEYDIDNASDVVRAPPRQSLDGKTLEVSDVKIFLPRKDDPWITSRNGKTFYKKCRFKIFYSEGGQQELISGLSVFKADDGKYTQPSIARDGKTQASKLMTRYAAFREKDIKEVSMKEFLSYLKSKPKVLMQAEEYENPNTGEKIQKNMIGKFL